MVILNTLEKGGRWEERDWGLRITRFESGGFDPD